jgi:hypothetical protein
MHISSSQWTTVVTPAAARPTRRARGLIRYIRDSRQMAACPTPREVVEFQDV